MCFKTNHCKFQIYGRISMLNTLKLRLIAEQACDRLMECLHVR